MKVRCFIVCQDNILFSDGFFYPEKINYWENKHGGNAENSHFKGFYERTRGNTA